MVLEFVIGGELFKYLRKSGTRTADMIVTQVECISDVQADSTTIPLNFMRLK